MKSKLEYIWLDGSKPEPKFPGSIKFSNSGPRITPNISKNTILGIPRYTAIIWLITPAIKATTITVNKI